MAEPDPSVTGYEECEDEEPTTFCDLDVTNNVWVEGVVDVPAGKRGICMLDTMTEAQVIYVLQHTPQAREDLPKVTSNATLLGLLDTVPLLPRENASDKLQASNTKNPDALPFYNVFRGQPPRAR